MVDQFNKNFNAIHYTANFDENFPGKISAIHYMYTCRYAHAHTYVYLCALFTEKHTELYAFLEMTCILGIVSVVNNYCNPYQHDHLYFCLNVLNVGTQYLIINSF